jgi:outer membrane lipoprotein-sorting protein
MEVFAMTGVGVRRPALRWIVPPAVLVVALVAGGAGRVLTADAAPALPPRTAAQLLVDLQTAKPAGFSGTVVQKSDLGLPELPSLGGTGRSNSSDLSSLTSGSHTLRVWYGAQDKQRVALLGQLGESDVIRNGKDYWTWSSTKNTATHGTLPADHKAGRKAGHPAAPTPTALPSTPQAAADQALAAISATTVVSTDGTATVAGRSAYELVLAPKDKTSKIRDVRLAIDSERKIPLRVRVYARGGTTPAIEVGFTEITFKQPAAAQFTFTPPPGAKVTQQKGDGPRIPGAPGRSNVVGTGGTSIVTSGGNLVPGDKAANGLLASLPKVSGSWGSGRLLTSKLFSVLLVDDGRVLAGAVDPAALYKAAAK